MAVSERAAFDGEIRIRTGNELILPGRGRNLSMTGLGFATRARFDPGELVRVTWLRELIEVDGRVVWCERTEDGWRGGVQFADVPFPYDQAIQQLIADAGVEGRGRHPFPGDVFIQTTTPVWQRTHCYDLSVNGAGLWAREALSGRINVAMRYGTEEPITARAHVVWNLEDAGGFRAGIEWLDARQNGPRVVNWLRRSR